MRLFFLRQALLVLILATTCQAVRADEILFIGNSFTFGATAPTVEHNGGVPALFAGIARAKGKRVEISAVTAGGKDWSYHLAQPVTKDVLRSKIWTWVVLQDLSTQPTHMGDVRQFLKDGETFSTRIAENSPAAGILLFETWARPPGAFYRTPPGDALSGPQQMMHELHQSYGRLRDDLAAKNKNRPARVALVGTAFAEAKKEYPSLSLDASDQHHASAEGYYLAALVIYETIYRDSVKDAPGAFFHGQLIIPTNDAAKLQEVADEVVGAAQN